VAASNDTIAHRITLLAVTACMWLVYVHVVRYARILIKHQHVAKLTTTGMSRTRTKNTISRDDVVLMYLSTIMYVSNNLTYKHKLVCLLVSKQHWIITTVVVEQMT
jgi:hypothetical protein